nr:cytochrome c oxidase subunit II [Paraburkholderia aromaticivorans]
MHLGWGLTALCVAVVAIIAVLLVAALVRRRPAAPPRALGKEEGGMGWIYIGVGVSTLALLVSLFYTLVTLQAVAQPSLSPGLSITVTAYDWWWKIDYGDDSDPAGHFVTANEIHIPVGVPVRIGLRSADVIHAFWVPRLAGKTQAIPGQVNTQWIQADAPGVYHGQCTQFCGAQHAHMAFDVVAQPQADFDAWRGAQLRRAAFPADGQVQTGQKIFMDRCAGCHAVRGSDAAGVQAPDLTHVGSRGQLAAGTLTNTSEHLLDWVQHAQQIKPDSLMPSITLTVQEAAALSAYLATLH